MEAKLFQRSNGFWYVYIKRGELISLKTKDKALAKKLFQIIAEDFSLIEIYRNILKRLNSLSLQIYKQQKKIQQILNPYDDSARETEIEKFIIEHIVELGITLLGKQRKIASGRVDILGMKDDRTIAIEAKAGMLTEYHLGQCLRYLNDPEISEVYLIGEDIDKSVRIFKQFDIQIYTVNLRGNGEQRFKKYEF